MKIGIIIQARLGSTRLKNKMALTFFEKMSLAEVIFITLKTLKPKFPIVLATTSNTNDDVLTELAIKVGIKVYRGSENNVLSRFIEASGKLGIDIIVRVCADNPFINIQSILDLIEEHSKGQFDYTSFAFQDGTPTIKSQIGLFAEVVSLKALKIIAQSTVEKTYLEHVTNYIYSNQSQFYINFIPMPEHLEHRRDIRLTIDTQNDFDAMQFLYRKVYPYQQNLEVLLSTIENSAELKSTMQKEIQKNEKAIYLSGLGEWYEQNGKNLNLKLGENGTKISGGQKQRIAIARALFEKCEILIFDEATSSLDNQTEELINDSIKQLKKEGLTMIIIAHRFSSLEHCDKIYELENGELILQTKFFTK